MTGNQNYFEGELLQSLQYGFIHSIDYRNGSHGPQILMNKPEQGQYVLTEIQNELMKCHSFSISVAFLTQAGIAMIKAQLADFIERGGKGRILISPYLGFNDPIAMKELLKLDNVEVRLANNELNMHSKIYLFEHDFEQNVIVGSSNLTHGALKQNYEWNIKLTSAENGDFITRSKNEYDQLWQQSERLTFELIDQYDKNRQPLITNRIIDQVNVNEEKYGSDVQPNLMQEEALKGLRTMRERGEKKALVISATGTGKTYLSAFDVRQYKPNKFLFVVHREQILRKAQEDYKRVIGFQEEESCIYKSGMNITNKKYVFATIQTLAREENLQTLDKHLFDYILIDEVHKAQASTYVKVINHFSPEFLVGMTATPERTDGQNIYELFDYNIAYEIRLQAALEEEMLCPFMYYGVSEFRFNGNLLDEKTNISRLTSDERVKHIMDKTHFYGVSGEKVRGLMFCSSKIEAKELSVQFNQQGLRTVALTGDDTQEVREHAVNQLQEGHLDYILTVDIFNEGIDIPSVNQVVLLRDTQSSIVFIQQLGRGLRKHESKEYVTIIDFIGNYRNNYLIPIALYGDKSMNKDNLRRNVSKQNQLRGLTTVNFEAVAQQQVFNSIKINNLSLLSNLKESYLTVKNRIGKIPLLMDFINQDNIDPSTFFKNSAFMHHGDVIRRFDTEDINFNFTDYGEKVLRFMTNELMNGKRPHELTVMNELIRAQKGLSVENIKTLFEQRQITFSEELLNSCIAVLELSFYKKQAQFKYGETLLIREGDRFDLTEDFKNLLNDPWYAKLVDDIINVGMYNSRVYPTGYGDSPLMIGAKYTRKDVCRLLLWDQDDSSTIYGYQIKHKTCPIFVNYHKSDLISETTQYGDTFINEKAFHWYTRSSLTLESKEVKQILQSQNLGIDVHLFVQKDELEKGEFYYLGEIKPISGTEKQKVMSKKDETVPVVTLDFSLEHPVPFELYNYLVTR